MIINQKYWTKILKKQSCFAFILASFVFASPLTWETLIQSATEDPVLKAAENRVKSISSGPSTKLWKDLEFRYKLDGFGFLEHDFELRLKPGPIGEQKAVKNFWKHQKRYQEARKRVDESQLIYDRYERALRYVTRQKIAEINESLFEVNQDRITVLNAKVGSETFDALDLMNAIEKGAALRAELISDSTTLRDIEMKLRSWVPDFEGIALDSSWLPSMEELNAVLQKTAQVDSTFPTIDMARAKWELSKERLMQENVSDRDMLSHVGIGYKHIVAQKKYKWMGKDDFKPGDTRLEDWKSACEEDGFCEIRLLNRTEDNRRTMDKFYLNVAIKLPFFSNNNDDLMRRQLSVLDAESDYLEESRTLNQKVARLYEEIMALIVQWNVQKDFVAQVDAGSIFQEFAAMAGSDPLLLLKAREAALASNLKAVKLEHEVYFRYLVLLDYAGVFARRDIHNHLKEGLN